VCAPAKLGESTDRYLRLVNWDSVHYQKIAETGYVIPAGKTIDQVTSGEIHEYQANLMFFPGYPLAARAVRAALGVSTPVALLIVSHLASLGFWIYFQLLLARFDVRRSTVLAAMGVALAHPASFFLIAGYAESLFLCLLFGLFYWSGAGRADGSTRLTPLQLALACVHGFGMGATRIVGVGAAPVALMSREALRQPSRGLLIGALSVSGAASYFVYCHFEFGAWNAYMRLNEIGWGNFRDWLALFEPWNYVPRFFFEHTVESINRCALPLVAVLAWVAWRGERARQWKEVNLRLGLYFAAFFLFYIPVTGKAYTNFESMIRIGLPPTLTLFVAVVSHYPQGFRLTERAPSTRALLYGALLLSIAVQIWFLMRFTRGHWVA
jgi:hypothetical protein